MHPIARCLRVVRTLALCLPCAVATCAWSQSNRGQPAPRPQGDVFNTQGERGGPCDPDVWIRSHGGRWDRCEYERQCPSLDTKVYGEPDRFPATDGARMRGYVRCAVDPCSPGGAQCWGRPGSDAINTEGMPGKSPSPKPVVPANPGGPGGGTASGAATDAAPSGRKALKRTRERPSASAAADAGMLVDAIDRCIREKGRLRYYVSPGTRQSSGSLASYDGASETVTYNPAQLNRQPPYVSAYFLASAFADHVVKLKEQRYGQSGTAGARQQQRDYLVGYLAHCLFDERLLPRATGNNDPRLQFQDFLYLQGGRVPLDPATLARGNYFSYGWWRSGLPLLPETIHER